MKLRVSKPYKQFESVDPSRFLSKDDDLIVGTTSGSRGLTIFSGTANTGNIFFADTDTGGVGTVSYTHLTLPTKRIV